MNNYINNVYGFLKVIDQKREEVNGKKRTILQCECLRCGTKKWIRSDSVTSGAQISCGCYNKDINFHTASDLSDREFGRLTAKYDTGKRSDNGSVIWLCDCSCGGFKEVSATDLTRKRVISCGCVAGEWQSKHGKEIAKATKEVCIEDTNVRNLTMKTPKSNTSGFKGVTWDKDRNLWKAQIEFKKKNYYLGRYANKADAVKARQEAEDKLFGNFLEWYKNEYN